MTKWYVRLAVALLPLAGIVAFRDAGEARRRSTTSRSANLNGNQLGYLPLLDAVTG